MGDLQDAVDRLVLQLKGTDNEAKVAALKDLEEQLRLPEVLGVDAQDACIDPLKLALKSGNSRVSASALSCTLALFEKLQRHNDATLSVRTLQHALVELLPSPGVVAYLSDAKETTRQLAGRTLLAAGTAAATLDQFDYAGEPLLATLDKLVKEQAFGSKNARAREQGLIYLTALRKCNAGLPLRPWVPLLVAALEDSDAVVRDTARESVIAIFTMPDISGAARADLKKEMLKAGVRRTSSEAVLKGVLGGPSSASSPGSSTNGDGQPMALVLAKDEPSTPSATGKTAANRGERLLKKPKEMTQEAILADIEAQAAAAAPAPVADPSSGELKVVYIASRKDLEQEFRAMTPTFEGKETEHNWSSRESAIFRMRGMLKGGVHSEYLGAFVAEVKGLQEGIVKALLSLRTTLAATACQLVFELAVALKADFDPLHDTLSSSLHKMATLTKKTIAQLSQDALEAIIQNCPYHFKLLGLLAGSLDQKNVQARVYASSQVKTLLHVQAPKYQAAISASGGADLLSQAVQKSLGDANATVRENGRAMYYAFAAIWKSQAEVLLDSLDATRRKQLEQADPQKTGKTSGPNPTARTVSGTSAASTRPSMRAMINQRRVAQSSGASLTDPPMVTEFVDTEEERTPVKRLYSARASVQSQFIDGTTPSTPTGPSNAFRTHTFPEVGSNGRVPYNGSDALTTVQSPKTVSSAQNTPLRTPGPPSPTLQAMVHNDDYSTFEGYTVELASTVPMSPNMSTDGESIVDKRESTPQRPPAPLAAKSNNIAFDRRILDHLHDTTLLGNDSFEVDEAVQGRAEQAEQTAHRFLELVETDDADNRVLDAGEMDSTTVPVSASTDSPSRSSAVTDTTTPLLKRMADLHLKETPAGNGHHAGRGTQFSSTTSNWWSTKAKLEVGKAKPLQQTEFLDLVMHVERKGVHSDAIIRLARFSADYSGSEHRGIWLEGRAFTRLLDVCCHSLRQDNEAANYEPALVLLLNLVTNQTDLLGGREGEVVSLLLDLRRNSDKNVAAASQIVLQLFTAKMDTLYGLATLQASLEAHLTQHRGSDGTLDPSTATSYSTGLDCLGRLYTDLPSEVLEEEIARARDLIKAALNNQTYPHLRQAAITALAKANLVLQDDSRLFDLIGGLTKSQIHLCTYLFAREAANARSAA